MVNSEDNAAGALIGHPATARLFQAGRRLRQWDARRPWMLDTAVVLMVFLTTGLADLFPEHGRSDAPIVIAERPLAQLLLLQAALILPLWWRRRAPLTVFYAVLVAFVAEWSAGIILRADAAILVALYSLVLHGQLRRLPWAGPGLVTAVTLVVVHLSGTVRVWDVLFFAANVGTAAVALGFAIRIRRAQLEALRQRAVQLEVERDQRSRLATATERTRVAREMHDILGHSLSVIITLADGGQYAADVTPEHSKEALRLIADTGRTSLAELRRMLGLLRDQTGEPDRHPQPGVADLDPLCRQISAAGPHVDYQSSGPLDTLDRGVQLVTYRIVQEALTNSLKHAGPATRIQLRVRVRDNRLRISVHDTGPAAPDRHRRPAGEGHGMLGMHERAAMYGGTVTAGPAPDGGWTVDAGLDLENAPT